MRTGSYKNYAIINKCVEQYILITICIAIWCVVMHKMPTLKCDAQHFVATRSKTCLF